MKRRAFTLIELLVVISIIALLVGILLPALGAARETAKLAVCASGLHQMGVGVMAYAIDYDSYLPSDEQTTANFGPYNLYSGRIWPTQVAAQTGFNGFKRFHNLGRLYDKEYIGDEDIFYCPSMETEPYTRNTYDSPWPAPKVGAASPNGRVHTSYQFNPRVAEPVVNMESHAQKRRYERIDDFKTADVLVMDMVAKEVTLHSLSSVSVVLSDNKR